VQKCYLGGVETIPQKELRNDVGRVLRRAEGGEQLTITVAGRPVARLGPAPSAQWVPSRRLKELWSTASDPTFRKDLEGMGGEMIDPWD
jgi:prevent-host-death family protein